MTNGRKGKQLPFLFLFSFFRANVTSGKRKHHAPPRNSALPRLASKSKTENGTAFVAEELNRYGDRQAKA